MSNRIEKNYLISCFDREFRRIDAYSRNLLTELSEELLFSTPALLNSDVNLSSCGECIIRSAAVTEQTFGGITTRLWDDPFEWTLPEKLSSRGKILDYLDEVEQTRLKGFSYFAGDDDLGREIPAPIDLKSIARVLIETLTLASHHQGRARAIFQMLANEMPPLR